MPRNKEIPVVWSLSSFIAVFRLNAAIDDSAILKLEQSIRIGCCSRFTGFQDEFAALIILWTVGVFKRFTGLQRLFKGGDFIIRRCAVACRNERDKENAKGDE